MSTCLLTFVSDYNSIALKPCYQIKHILHHQGSRSLKDIHDHFFSPFKITPCEIIKTWKLNASGKQMSQISLDAVESCTAMYQRAVSQDQL